MPTKNQKCTRFYSNQQEQYIASLMGGKLQSNSGASLWVAGDVVTQDWLFEAKTVMSPHKSVALKKEWFEKNERERKDLMKPYSALWFQFEPDGENYVVVNEKTFKLLYDNFQNVNEE